MPEFTGNLKDLGIDPRPGMQSYLKFTVERAGITQGGQIVAGSTEVTPDAAGNVTVTLASTVGLIPPTMVKLTGGWLGEDSFFDFPPFHVPELDGTLGDLINLADVTVSGLIGYGLSAPPEWFNGLAWIDISVNPPLLYPREF